ncbi:MAG: GTPase Era [Treponema sp.]|jgi:GTP-binding protein Era|nr:GTPase Era [Treponema sp.]
MEYDKNERTVKNMRKAAFIAVIGRPSVGKSTLVNRLCGEKVAIVSAVPQTTRNAIRGIVNREEGQLVFIDTPGRHLSEKKLNKKLQDVSDRSIADAEIVLYVLDATRAPAEEEEKIAADLADALENPAEKLVFAINKMDSPDANFAAAAAFVRKFFPSVGEDRCFTISALKREGLAPLLDALFALSPEGEAFYPEEYYTDQDVRFRIAEIIREKAINRLWDELPHAIYVDVADAEFKENGTTLWVRAFIITERESQKGMIVGKGGSMIRSIRHAALKELKRIFEWKIELDLRVKAAPDWRHNDGVLKRLIE